MEGEKPFGQERRVVGSLPLERASTESGPALGGCDKTRVSFLKATHNQRRKGDTVKINDI